ncbi:PIN2/TERF1-interacting telomerase inhibitor 1-like isoform X1 [Carassius auratus]|uniref:PIN2/TERF1-interacting telomerase inhibitor 1-like isoform X1 n=2 Tax=Carassius auratus TaxID=7957 RepID=A0A6P6M0P7_CARAU|nr:PIN2/TERF1-interacting telomerase inhibitor 1-like isoform X1 [Carassius auratus]
MSMLAEPRRKQKWSVDPRNSAWSNDESKFGQKMLERMGWSKGKGLGKSEQGATEHIKVKVKNNGLGLGTTTNHEDNWIAHQDDFNQLLAELNSCHAQNNTDSPTQEQGFSLEEKSKTSKKRVHYMKFTKGKDLSSRSETDLACIFGKRSKRETRDRDEGSSGPDSQEEREEDKDTGTNLNPETQSNTVTSTLTMQEYFAQRMAQIKKTQTGRDPAASSSEVSSNAPSPLATPASMEDSPNTSDIEQSKNKKKKKKDRESERDSVEEDALTSVTGECVEEPNCSQKKKKKKKRKREDGTEVGSAPTVMDGTTEEDAPTTGKRKKEKKTSPEVHADELKTIETGNMDHKVSDKKKKKKKRERDEEEGATEEVVPKKNKKKQKK